MQLLLAVTCVLAVTMTTVLSTDITRGIMNEGGEDQIFYNIFKVVSDNPEKIAAAFLEALEKKSAAEHIAVPTFNDVVDVEPTNELLHDTSSGCDGCKETVSTMNRYIRLLRWPWSLMRPIILRMCLDLTDSPMIEEDYMCPLMVDLYGPHIHSIIKDRKMSPEFVCGMINQCDRSAVFVPISVPGGVDNQVEDQEEMEKQVIEDLKVHHAKNLDVIAQAKVAQAKIAHAKVAKPKIAHAKVAKPKIAHAKVAKPKIVEAKLAKVAKLAKLADVKKPKYEKAVRKFHHLHKRAVNDENVLVIAHVSDIHLDQLYFEGGPTACGLFVCCREHFPGFGQAGHWGEYRCNLPAHSVDVLMSKLAAMNPDLVIYAGDNPGTAMYDETIQSVSIANQFAVNTMSKHFPDTRVYPVVGNHDLHPANLFYTGMDETRDYQEFFATQWAPLADFDEGNQATIRAAGYYSKMILPGLKLIVMNSNYGYTLNFYNLLAEQEPEYYDMKAFVEAELAASQANGEKVLFVTHHPPGGGTSIVEDGQWYSSILSQYADIISFHTAGHDHYDNFKVVLDPETNVPRHPIFIAQGLTPWNTMSVNPGFRLYYVDSTTYELLDFEQYYFDLTGFIDTEEPEAQLLYSAKEEYGLADMSAQSWMDLTYAFENDDVLFQKYWHNYRTGMDGTPCIGECKTTAICTMRSTDYTSYKRCLLWGFPH